VLKDQWGSGAGKMLMDHAIRFAREQGFTCMFLGVWQENKRALRFYEKAGFEIFSTRSFKLGSTLCDDFLLKVDLNK
jgi:ribosomal protein S18 acetylase RimI-like enzyme